MTLQTTASLATQHPSEPFPTELARRWAHLRREQPRLRQRDAAEALGVSEGALVASEVGGRAKSLGGDWLRLLGALESVGPVLALTRNPEAVIECAGTYRNVQSFGPMGQVLGDGIDLRLFFRRFHAAFALSAPTLGNDARPSLQFFDRHGDAIHKIFAVESTDLRAFEALIAAHAAPGAPSFEREAEPAPAERPDAEIDRDALLSAWEQLEDTHDFTRLLARLGVSRPQALRLGSPRFTERVALGAWRGVLEGAIAPALPVMVFVGSVGVIQIHTGPIQHVLASGEWFNVMQPGFNLHLYEPGVSEAWLVKKPTRDGVVTSLELYARDGRQIALFFCKRKEGQPESEQWRALLAGLPRV